MPRDAGRVGTVRGHGDVDDRIVEPDETRVGDADRGVIGKLDDSRVIVAELELRRRTQHPVRFDAADHAFGQGQLLAWNIRADRREDAFHARPCVRRAADDLHLPLAGVDDADPEPVGVGMRLGLDDGGDDEAVVLARRVFDRLNLEADAGQRVDDLGERGRGVEVVFQPGEGEFHCLFELPRGLALCEIVGALENVKEFPRGFPTQLDGLALFSRIGSIG